MTAACKRPERGETLFERPAGKAAAAQEAWGGTNILEAAVGGRAGELDRPRLDYLSPMVVSEMVEVRCPLVVGVRERLEPCSYLGGPGGPGGSPMVSPRSSPRHSPRSSPRVSPRASPRASPRVSPRSTPRRRSRAHSRDVTPLEELVVVSVPCRELKVGSGTAGRRKVLQGISAFELGNVLPCYGSWAVPNKDPLRCSRSIILY